MKKIILLVIALTACSLTAQVGVGTTAPDASASLDVYSTNSGFLMPRLTTAARTAIASPAAGLQVYDTDFNTIWYFNGTVWVNSSSGWGLTGNAGTNSTTNFLGTTDDIGLTFKVNGTRAGGIGNSTSLNASLGYGAGLNLTGTGNVAIGARALSSATSANNVAVGLLAMYSTTTGSSNVAVGSYSLIFNTTGSNNAALGYNSLSSNTTGGTNNAFGVDALRNNKTGSGNVAIGYHSLLINLSGSSNTVVGSNALFSNSTDNNNAFGANALYGNSIGSNNSAFGYNALYTNATGSGNNAFGNNALTNSTGSNNLAVGLNAGLGNTTGANNVMVGNSALANNTTGSNNVALGTNAGPDALSPALTNSIAIGYNAVVSASNAMVLGNGVNVGIGTSTPAAKLDIVSATAGAIKITDGTQGLNKVLTSDANGLATWATPTAAVTASNGLTATSGDVKLGGALTISTTVSGLSATTKMAFTSAPANAAAGLNAFSVDGTTFSIDTFNNMIGIGTTTPSSRLDIVDSGSSYGISVINTGGGLGIYSSSSTNIGVFGVSGNTANFGLYGANTSATGTGVMGFGNGLGTAYYLSVTGSGAAFTGKQYGVYANVTLSGSGNTDRAAFYGEYNANSTPAAVYVGARIGGVNYKILGPGSSSVSTTMPTRSGERILFAPEAPENWFFDIGEAELVNGKATVTMDPIFVDCIADSKPFKVFVQSAEGTKGSVKVTRNQKEKTFVLEDIGGASNGTVQYIIYAIWKQKEGLRFPEYKRLHQAVAREAAKDILR